MASPFPKSELLYTDTARLMSSTQPKSVALPYQEILRQQELERISERWLLIAEMMHGQPEE